MIGLLLFELDVICGYRVVGRCLVWRKDNITSFRIDNIGFTRYTNRKFRHILEGALGCKIRLVVLARANIVLESAHGLLEFS
jgi:hypothetical protein